MSGVLPHPGPGSRCRIARRLVAALVSCALASGAQALELGFEARTFVQSSDNIDGDNAGLEDEGLLGTASVGIYGEQRGTFARGGFRGVIDTRRELDEADDDWDTITHFMGAAEFRLTPRVFRWYVGDVLGGVRLDDADQPITDFRTRRRNVFVTGPDMVFQIDAASQFNARLLYLIQSEGGEELETLYNGFAEFNRERTPGSRWGVRGSDVYTDATEIADQEDFNRTSVSAFLGRKRGFWNVRAELGATRYSTDDTNVDGVLSELGIGRQLGPSSRLSLTLRRDLNDRTLGTVQGLLADGDATQQQSGGIYESTSVGLIYGLLAGAISVDLGIGASQLDYMAVTDDAVAASLVDEQDQLESHAFAYLTRPLGTRTKLRIGARYERETFDNLPDETRSVLASATLAFQLSRSFELEGSYLFDRADGSQSVGGADGRDSSDIDRTENRFGIGLRWAPPSRVSEDLTIELKSLLQ